MEESMTLSEELQWRGFYNQSTFDHPSDIDNARFTLYLGADPSADSLHVGHLAVYMFVRQFLERGHKVILLVGGGTGFIGDMRDTEERELKPLDEISSNTDALAAQISTLFSGKEFKLVDNYDWLSTLSLLPFLRDIGKTFNMKELTSREFYKARTGENSSGLSFAEFSYTILQGYDFYQLYNEYGVNLQIGGSDQWGNLLSGVELIRKKTGATVHALSSPLVINKSTGRKFGKSEGGAVWLSSDKTSVFQFYQFWFNVDDESVIDYLKLFTLLSRDEIEAITENHRINPGARSAQKRLAMEVTSLVHGVARAQRVVKVIDVLFGKVDVVDLSLDECDALAAEIGEVQPGHLVEILCESGLATSNGDARRLLSGGAISLNGQKVSSDQDVTGVCLIKKGKNRFVLVR